MCTVKTQKHHLLLYISTIVPNDTRIHVILKVPRTISFNCCTCKFQHDCTRMNKEKEQVTIFDNYAKSEISWKYRWSALFFNVLSFVLISHHFMKKKKKKKINSTLILLITMNCLNIYAWFKVLRIFNLKNLLRFRG